MDDKGSSKGNSARLSAADEEADVIRVVPTLVILLGSVVLGVGISLLRRSAGGCQAVGAGVDACASPEPLREVVWALFEGVILRPLTLEPFGLYVARLAEGPLLRTASPLLVGLLAALAASLSAVLLAGLARPAGRIWVFPWIEANLPSAASFLRARAIWLVVLFRWLPFVQFDVMSIVFGALCAGRRTVFLGSFVVLAVEGTMFAYLGEGGSFHVIYGYAAWIVSTVVIVAVAEIFVRTSAEGGSLLRELHSAWREASDELRARNRFSPAALRLDGRPVVVLLYGFFSSHRAVAPLAELLAGRGLDVVTLDLGGFLGVFNTRSIPTLAHLLDAQIETLKIRHQSANITVVGHSKGGLVAAWWLMRQGGWRHCRKVVTMATPFRGTWLARLACLTPLGLLWPDVWQMSPGSSLLRKLAGSAVPEGTRVWCFTSSRDRVTRRNEGILGTEAAAGRDRISVVDFSGLGHFDFMESRDVASSIGEIAFAGGEEGKS